jgi:protein-disulfide isomerase
MTSPSRPGSVPAGATSEGDAILLGQGPVRLDAFIDFQCPFCQQFELSAGPAVAGLISDGRVNAAYHPMNFLDAASTTRYSTRAAAASGCAADQNRFLEYMHVLFVNQPPEGGAGLTDAELAALGQAAGLDPAFASCVSAPPYLDWPSFVTARAMAAGVDATPTVLVAGLPVSPDAQTIAAAVASATAAG